MDNLPVDWTHEVRYNVRQKREEGLTPYREAARWRYRCILSLLLNLALGLLVLLLVGAQGRCG